MFNAKEKRSMYKIHIIKALLAISFDMNQIKSMRPQSSLLTMNNQVNDFAQQDV